MGFKGGTVKRYNSYMRNYPKKATEDREESPMHEVSCYLANSLFYILKSKSDELKLPISRLIAIAIDNELDSTVPFSYPCPMPQSPYVEGAFDDEAMKIFRFLQRFPSGTGIDTLTLCRRDMEIKSRTSVLAGLRELLERKMIEAFRPRKTKFKHAEDYMYFRIFEYEKKDLKKPRYKKVQEEDDDTAGA